VSTNLEIYLSISKPLERVNTELSNTKLSVIDIMVIVVRFLFLPRLEMAIFHSFPPSVDLLAFFLICSLFPLYRTASTGVTFPAIFPGLHVLINTVTRANNEAPIKIKGFKETTALSPP